VPDTFEVDWVAVRSNAEWLISRGVRVLVVNGSIAEHASMSYEEQVRAVGETVQAAAGRATVIAGCSHTNPDQSLALCNAAREQGADAVLLLPPYYFRLSPTEIESFFEWLDGCIDLPFLVYDNPATGRTELPVESIERIARCRNFAGLKEASPDVLRFYSLIERFGSRFPVVAAVEDPLLFMLVAGAPACMTATAAFAPQLLAELMAAVEAGNLTVARSTFRRLYAFRELFLPEIRAGRPAFVAYTKAAVDLVGATGGPPRPPLAPLTSEQHRSLRETLQGPMGLALPEESLA
jgi:4-hydroxy-tetrahydrodipicolinate synthase